MSLTRRRLLVAAAAVPGYVAIQGLIRSLGDAATALRPAATGTTADRCAACGAEGHSMLDRICPAAPRVLS